MQVSVLEGPEELEGYVGVAPGTTTMRVFGEATPEQVAADTFAELVRYHKTQTRLQVITTVSLATLAALSIVAILRDGLSTRRK